MKERLPYTTFNIPVAEIRCGHYSAVYFWREKRILEMENIRRKGLMQIFNKVEGATVCGIDEALAILRLCTGHFKDYEDIRSLFAHYIYQRKKLQKKIALADWEAVQYMSRRLYEAQESLNDLWIDTHDQLNIQALYDGEESSAFHAIMTIEGPGTEFAHLESVYLGILARATKVATNTKRVVKAAGGKPILLFADRFDRYENQIADGYATMKAGAHGIATDAMGQWLGIEGMGTTPHALIAFYCGDTPAATLAFAKHYPNVNAIALVDFHNDCVATSLAVAREFAEAGIKLWGVRLDTSGTLVDKSVASMMGLFKPTGVCAQLVENVRRALDKEEFDDVKIVVSGGFNKEKISEFERLSVPVDAYGVGSSLLQGSFDHTADIVIVDGEPMAKIGRQYNPGPNLKQFNWSEIEP